MASFNLFIFHLRYVTESNCIFIILLFQSTSMHASDKQQMITNFIISFRRSCGTIKCGFHWAFIHNTFINAYTLDFKSNNSKF